MSKRDELIEKYAKALEEKAGVKPDMDLLRKVTIGCGPSIYNKDSSTISANDPAEMDRVKKNFLMKKLGIAEGAKLDAGLDAVIEQYGKSDRNKYRAAIYYLLTKHFKKESVYA
ncbi:MAG: DUF2853 family protein [Pseudomonadota bacterium]